ARTRRCVYLQTVCFGFFKDGVGRAGGGYALLSNFGGGLCCGCSFIACLPVGIHIVLFAVFKRLVVDVIYKFFVVALGFRLVGVYQLFGIYAVKVWHGALFGFVSLVHEPQKALVHAAALLFGALILHS